MSLIIFTTCMMFFESTLHCVCVGGGGGLFVNKDPAHIKHHDGQCISVLSLTHYGWCIFVCWTGSPLVQAMDRHYGVITLKLFPRYWPFVRGIHRSPVNSPHKGQWRGALMFSLICAWTNIWPNNRDPGDLRRHRAHYDATVILPVRLQ